MQITNFQRGVAPCKSEATFLNSYLQIYVCFMKEMSKSFMKSKKKKKYLRRVFLETKYMSMSAIFFFKRISKNQVFNHNIQVEDVRKEK